MAHLDTVLLFACSDDAAEDGWSQTHGDDFHKVVPFGFLNWLPTVIYCLPIGALLKAWLGNFLRRGAVWVMRLLKYGRENRSFQARFWSAPLDRCGRERRVIGQESEARGPAVPRVRGISDEVPAATSSRGIRDLSR